MVYPFTPMPTLRDFIDRARSIYGTQIIKVKLNGPRGNIEISSLVRNGTDGKKKIAVIPDLKDNEFLVPNVLRSLCVQLDIPLKDFGFTLD